LPVEPLATLQVSAPAPPVAENWNEYGTPTVPEGSGEGLVMLRGGGLMWSERLFVVVWLTASVTLAVNENVPLVVGVPESRPDGASERLAVVPPARLHVSAPVPPAAVSWKE
jgi:hypothetical protein